MAIKIIKIETPTLNNGIITDLKSVFSLPKVVIIVSVSVSNDTLAEVKLITALQTKTASLLFTCRTIPTIATVMA